MGFGRPQKVGPSLAGVLLSQAQLAELGENAGQLGLQPKVVVEFGPQLLAPGRQAVDPGGQQGAVGQDPLLGPARLGLTRDLQRIVLETGTHINFVAPQPAPPWRPSRRSSPTS